MVCIFYKNFSDNKYFERRLDRGKDKEAVSIEKIIPTVFLT